MKWTKKKEIRLNLLEMNCVGTCPGMWSHPGDETVHYTSLDYWMDLARLLERGLFDSLFIADILGVYDVYGGHVDIERMLTLFSGYTGIDFSGQDVDQHLDYFESSAIQTFVEIFTKADANRAWTLREVAQFLGIGGFAPIEVGSPQTLATRMEHWMEVTDLDGFNLTYAVSPGDVRNFVDLVVPELQQLGLYKTSYAPGTFREKLFDEGHSQLPKNHTADQFRC